ncbi:Uncharacterised protein [Mycobacteroides abscessus subsp. abscessus]|nr:Uncharacterised protein [Mycobacteroides abscessus subsp. abscessus]
MCCAVHRAASFIAPESCAVDASRRSSATPTSRSASRRCVAEFAASSRRHSFQPITAGASMSRMRPAEPSVIASRNACDPARSCSLGCVPASCAAATTARATSDWSAAATAPNNPALFR